MTGAEKALRGSDYGDFVGRHLDREFYLTRNPDVANLGRDPVEHFLDYGRFEGRDPASWFSMASYRREHGVSQGDDPFLHLFETGEDAAELLKQAMQGEAGLAVPGPYVTALQALKGAQVMAPINDVVVYTAIASSKHSLRNNTTYWPDLRAYREEPADLPWWQSHPSLFVHGDPKLTVLFHKYGLPSLFAEGTKLIWTDSRVSLQMSVIEDMARRLEDSDLCLFKCPGPVTLADELDTIERDMKAPAVQVEAMRAAVRSRAMSDAQVYETGAMGIRASDRTAQALREVYNLSQTYIARDRATFALAIGESDLKLSFYNDGRSSLRDTNGVFVASDESFALHGDPANRTPDPTVFSERYPDPI